MTKIIRTCLEDSISFIRALSALTYAPDFALPLPSSNLCGIMPVPLARQGCGARIPSRSHGFECVGKPADGLDLEEGLLWLNKQPAGSSLRSAQLCVCTCVRTHVRKPLVTFLCKPVLSGQAECFFRVTLTASCVDARLSQQLTSLYLFTSHLLLHC